MKKKIIALVALCLSFAAYLNGCPTCVGRLNTSDDPFFSDRYYQNITKALNVTDDEDSDSEEEQGDDHEKIY